MIQTGLLQNAHTDLVTDATYDYYGIRLATCSLDQRIKVWQLNEADNTWSVKDDWKAHDAAISKLSWAHPEFGSILASSSFDRTVKVWEQVNFDNNNHPSADAADQPTASRWVERAVLYDAKGTVRAVEFAPHHFGLKFATISTDDHLRVYESLDAPAAAASTSSSVAASANNASWQLFEEVDLSAPSSLPSIPTSTRMHTAAISTPTQASSKFNSADLEAGVQQRLGVDMSTGPSGSATSVSGRSEGGGIGTREADGGWCVSWCKDRYWGETLAVSSGVPSVVKIIQLSSSRRAATVLVLDPSPSQQSYMTGSIGRAGLPSAGVQQSALTAQLQLQHHNQNLQDPSPPSSLSAQGGPVYSITSVSWAPSCGRSYHLIATGSRDGHVRIWKVRPAEDLLDEHENRMDESAGLGGLTVGANQGGDASGKDGWSASLVGDFDDHKSSVGKVEWNITGTILSSTGNDGKVRLWKATDGGKVWRAAGSISVEQPPENPSKDSDANGTGEKGRDKDVDMGS